MPYASEWEQQEREGKNLQTGCSMWAISSETPVLDIGMFRKKLMKCYVWSIALYGADSCVDSSETRSEVAGKFWNVVLEKDGEDKLGGPHK
jgi:hypothetical protein